MDLVVLTDAAACKVVATSQVLKHADAASVMEAAQLLVLARQREAATVAQARAAQQQAREQGLKDGREQARAEYAGRYPLIESTLLP